ncbi:MAG: hypothetical protein NTZ05_08300, partial [Chloroflexi bacterium]|nr:hypothetical protein [Chloroflexota bacterium]
MNLALVVALLAALLWSPESGAAAFAAAPIPQSPPDNATLPNFTVDLVWQLPPGAVQYHIQV